jgi:hypothetical protein
MIGQAVPDYKHSILALALHQCSPTWTGLLTPAQHCTYQSVCLNMHVQIALVTHKDLKSAGGNCRKREKRKMEESLRKVKTLGQADEDIDDLAKWVTKSRTKAEEEKELAREEALAAAERRQNEQVWATCIYTAPYVCLSRI